MAQTREIFHGAYGQSGVTVVRQCASDLLPFDFVACDRTNRHPSQPVMLPVDYFLEAHSESRIVGEKQLCDKAKPAQIDEISTYDPKAAETVVLSTA